MESNILIFTIIKSTFYVLQQNSLIATDVKVAPGGTENVDTDIYEAVVLQPIMEPQVSLGFIPPALRYTLFLFVDHGDSLAAWRASVPRSGPRDNRPSENQPDIREEGQHNDAAKGRPGAHQPADRHRHGEKESHQHQAQNPCYLQQHQGDPRDGQRFRFLL